LTGLKRHTVLPPLKVLGSAGYVPHCLHPVSDEGGDRAGRGAPGLFLHKFAAGGGLLVKTKQLGWCGIIISKKPDVITF
jgi:hypothetical protein